MNTHSDGLYGTLSTLYKRKTLVRLESATPAVDRPVAKVELMQVREVMLFLSLRLTTVPSCHASSFINQFNNKGFTTKEESNMVSYSLYRENGELSSQGLNISPMKQIYTNIQCVAI